jgi:hypothetical protein
VGFFQKFDTQRFRKNLRQNGFNGRRLTGRKPADTDFAFRGIFNLEWFGTKQGLTSEG